jgi:hypothetical protein
MSTGTFKEGKKHGIFKLCYYNSPKVMKAVYIEGQL